MLQNLTKHKTETEKYKKNGLEKAECKDCNKIYFGKASGESIRIREDQRLCGDIKSTCNIPKYS